MNEQLPESLHAIADLNKADDDFCLLKTGLRATLMKVEEKIWALYHAERNSCMV